MSKKDWRKVKFEDYVEINPKVRLERGEEYPFVMMEAISPGTKRVSPCGEKHLKGGGSRFEDRDTLFARITPCLENGKIAQYRGSPAFGSTEFFVFRAKSGVSDPDYVYYLSMTKTIRGLAEKSMAGASGRQRADIASIKDLIIDFPDLPTQRRIASILSAYDNLIENNNRRIKILEQMAQMIYREWFVNFRFPGYEKVKMINSKLGKIPEGWRIIKLGEKVNISKGKNITESTVVEGRIPVVAGGLRPAYYHNEANTKAPVVTISASGANAGYINMYHENIWVSDCSYIDYDATRHVYFYYLLLKNRQIEVTNLQRGAAQPHVYPKDLMGLEIIDIPEYLVDSFESKAAMIFSMINKLIKQNQILSETRDLLLPKLVGGEVEV
jgi:type I restriction enzyme S subunit